MIKAFNVFGSFAVKDLKAAKAFYIEKLGLTVTEDAEMGGLLTIKAPTGGEVMVYEKPDHAPANFTVLNIVVADVEAAVDTLSAAGVKFEKYEGMEQDAKGISRGGLGPNIAWCTDPSGNIIAIFDEK